MVASEVQQVCLTFHPRYDASWRKYSYRIYCQPVREPLLEPYAWRVWPSVRLLPCRMLHKPLPGTHDFAAFGTPSHSGGNTSRVVLQADWKQVAPYLVFEITGAGFPLPYGAHVVFMQVMIAQGRLTVEGVARCLEDWF